MTKRIIHETVTTVTSEFQVIDLCEAGRYREAAIALDGLDPEKNPLAFGMVETARGNQELAKDYLSRAVREGAGDRATVQLACAYWRSGESKEAEALLAALPDSFEVLLLKAIVVGELDPRDALDHLARATKYQVSEGLQARLHNQRALLLRKIGEKDRAIQEYEAAVHYFELAGSDCIPIVIKNLAGVYSDYGEHARAHEQIDKAIALLRTDTDHRAKAFDQKARIYLAEGDYENAKVFATKAISLIENTDKKAWLAECVLTFATVFIRRQEFARALNQLERAEQIGSYLNNDQVVLDSATLKKQLGEELIATAEVNRIESALRSTDSIRAAAKKLQVSHVALLNSMDRYQIPHKPRRKSLIATERS